MCVFFFDLKNLRATAVRITIVRLFDFAANAWDEEVTALCEWCGQRFAPETNVLDAIQAIATNANVTPDRSACLELPASSWG